VAISKTSWSTVRRPPGRSPRRTQAPRRIRAPGCGRPNLDLHRGRCTSTSATRSGSTRPRCIGGTAVAVVHAPAERRRKCAIVRAAPIASSTHLKGKMRELLAEVRAVRGKAMVLCRRGPAATARRSFAMKNQSIGMLGAAAVLVASGCAYSAPYRTSGPSLSDKGVEVGLTGIRCYVNRGGDPLTDTNRRRPSRPRCEAADQQQLWPGRRGVRRAYSASSGRRSNGSGAPPRRAKVIALLPGETMQVPLRFMPNGVADCHHRFALEFGDSVEVDGAPVLLYPIDFQPKL